MKFTNKALSVACLLLASAASVSAADIPSAAPTDAPTQAPTTIMPTQAPTQAPTTTMPTQAPTQAPTTTAPTHAPTVVPTTTAPTQAPTQAPTVVPTTTAPTQAPTQLPTQAPTQAPTVVPTTTAPTQAPTQAPTVVPTTTAPTQAPTVVPTTTAPTQAPTVVPTTTAPTQAPTQAPTVVPTTTAPTQAPSLVPTQGPTQGPTVVPTTTAPTQAPTQVPTQVPTQGPTIVPTQGPTLTPTQVPTTIPTDLPTQVPTLGPTQGPTQAPTQAPTVVPTTTAPTVAPTQAPSFAPTPQNYETGYFLEQYWAGNKLIISSGRRTRTCLPFYKYGEIDFNYIMYCGAEQHSIFAYAASDTDCSGEQQWYDITNSASQSADESVTFGLQYYPSVTTYNYTCTVNTTDPLSTQFLGPEFAVQGFYSESDETCSNGNQDDMFAYVAQRQKYCFNMEYTDGEINTSYYIWANGTTHIDMRSYTEFDCVSANTDGYVHVGINTCDNDGDYEGNSPPVNTDVKAKGVHSETMAFAQGGMLVHPVHVHRAAKKHATAIKKTETKKASKKAAGKEVENVNYEDYYYYYADDNEKVLFSRWHPWNYIYFNAPFLPTVAPTQPPTMAPTVAQVWTFSTTQGIDGVSASDFNTANNTKAFCEAAAATFDNEAVTSDNCAITSITSTTVAARRKLRMLSTSDSISVVFSLTYNPFMLGYSTASAAYTALTNSYTTNVANGNFLTSLTSNPLSSSSLAAATGATTPSFTTNTEIVETDDESHPKKRHIALIVGIVVGLGGGLIFIALLAFFIFSGSSAGESHAPAARETQMTNSNNYEGVAKGV